MGFFKGLAIIAHTLVFLLIGSVLVSLSFSLFSSEGLVNILNFIYNYSNLKLAIGIIGGMFILFALLMAHINFTRLQAEKTIAFENPEGEVTVALSAVEDFIRKSVRHIPEVKELRSNVVANKKGINVMCRATLFADSNIPETTERIQGIVKSRVQEMLGVEEAINIKIHVSKISSKDKKESPAAPSEYDEASRHIPFRTID